MNPSTSTSAEMEFAFDIGHSSIGWAVLTGNETSVQLADCGAVVFPKDDCLARSRRLARQQRRHTRSTRQRIARMEKLLAHRKYFSAVQLAEKHKPGGGHPAPWLLAAKVLASEGKERLDWSGLWDVLRWYAHNRGYDPLAHMAGRPEAELGEEELKQRKEDTDKEQKAIQLMKDHGRETMAETVFAVLCGPFGLHDPLAVDAARLPFLQAYFKGNKAAFPRSIVSGELRRILEWHRGNLAGCDDELIRLLLGPALTPEDRAQLLRAGIRLPKRYAGGLLFGKLTLRFDNRIIAQCPFTGEKVPGRRCVEFLEYRWAERVADLRTGAPVAPDEVSQFTEHKDGSLRALSARERRALDARVRALGFLHVDPDKPDNKTGGIKRGRNELRDLLVEVTGSDRHNLETLLMVPNIKEAFRLVPIKKGGEAFRCVWGAFDAPRDVPGADGAPRYHDDPLRHRFLVQLLRGKTLTPAEVCRQLERIGKGGIAEKIREAARAVATGKGKFKPERFEALISDEFCAEPLKGRARYSTAKMREAIEQVFHPTQPRDPSGKGGCLENTRDILDAQLQMRLEQKTNNHLVRHRLLILRRLFDELRRAYRGNLVRTTVEVARELKELSGMTAKQKAKELAGKVNQHGEVSAQVAEALKDVLDSKGQPVVITASFIRKARVAFDLDRRDIYTGKEFDFAQLVHKTYDLDHIIPRSQRLSDALEALVITHRDINAKKENRTALEFIRWMNEPQQAGEKTRLGIVTEAQFRASVEQLSTKGHPDDARRRERRKKLLLTEKWEGKGFTPGDLTKTSFLAKLGKQQIEAVFSHMPENERPPVVTITGAVTKAFRDRTWGLFRELGAVNPDVALELKRGTDRIALAFHGYDPKHREQSEKEFARQCKELPTGKKLKKAIDELKGELPSPTEREEFEAKLVAILNEHECPQLRELFHWQRRNVSIKARIREISDLHHAVDAAALAFIARWIIPARETGVHDTIARCIVKEDLGEDDLRGFWEYVKSRELPKFYRFAKGNRLMLEDLPQETKDQLHRCLAKNLVVQHLPSDRSGMAVEENSRRFVRLADIKGVERAILRQRVRDEKTGKLRVKETDEEPSRCLGLKPWGETSKLKQQKAVRVITENYGIAIMDHAADPKRRFVVIPWHRVHRRLEELKTENANQFPRVLRNGQLIRVQNHKDAARNRVWRIRSVKQTLKLDLSYPDLPEMKDSGLGVWREVSLVSVGASNIKILARTLCGIASRQRES